MFAHISSLHIIFAVQPLEGGCFQLLSEVPDVGNKAEQLLFPIPLSLVVLALMCELSTALGVLILVFLINLLTLWLLNPVCLGAFLNRLSPDYSLFAVTRSLGSRDCQECDGCPSHLGCRVCSLSPSLYQVHLLAVCLECSSADNIVVSLKPAWIRRLFCKILLMLFSKVAGQG